MNTNERIELTVDDDTIQALIKAMSKPSRRAFDINRLLTAVQVAALVLAGAWTIGNYLAFQREANARQLEFATANAKVTEWQAKLNELAVATASTYRIKRTDDLTATLLKDEGDGWALYQIDDTICLENISQTPFDVSFWVSDVYVGEVKPFTPKGIAGFSVTLPNDDWLASEGPSESITWTKVVTSVALQQGSDLQAYKDKVSELVKDRTATTYGTGRFKGGESVPITRRHYIRAKKGSYVAVIWKMILDGGKSPDDMFSVQNSVTLDGVTSHGKSSLVRRIEHH